MPMAYAAMPMAAMAFGMPMADAAPAGFAGFGSAHGVAPERAMLRGRSMQQSKCADGGGGGGSAPQMPGSAATAWPAPAAGSAPAPAAWPAPAAGSAPAPAAAPAPPPAAAPPPPGAAATDAAAPGAARDLTKVPGELDARYGQFDVDGALRATVIAPSGPWAKKSHASLLSKAPAEAVLHAPEQAAARGAAFDLLDALSRSGALPLEHAALHVVMGATHCFDDALLDTVVQRSVNPVEKCERSLLIMATTLHQAPARALVRGEHVARLAGLSPALFEAPALAE